MEPKWWFGCLCYLLNSLIQLVLLIWNCLARVCLFRTVFISMFELIEIVKFIRVHRCNNRTDKIVILVLVANGYCIISHLRLLISGIKNINSAMIFGMQFNQMLYLYI